MKSLSTLLSITLTVFASVQVARADMIDWADDAAEYSANIQNYAGIKMDDSTRWWLTGPPDADQNHDYVGGWRSVAPNEYIVMHWGRPIADVPGDDLVIRLYGGPDAQAGVSASVDGAIFSEIGVIGGGTPNVFREEYFDFNGRLPGGVSYVKVERLADGPQTGMFFDAFGAAVIPEPGAMALLLAAAGCLVLWWTSRSRKG